MIRALAPLAAAILLLQSVTVSAFYHEELAAPNHLSAHKIVERDLAGEQKSSHLQILGRPGRSQKVSARGRLSLAQACALLLPRGWKTNLPREVEGSMVQLWVQEMPWPRALAMLGEQLGLIFILDWENKKITSAACPYGGEAGPKKSAWADAGGKKRTVGEATMKRSGKRGQARKILLKRGGTAREVARRLGLPVASFCQWNHVGPAALLGSGYAVFVEEPGDDTQVSSNLPSRPEHSRADLALSKERPKQEEKEKEGKEEIKVSASAAKKETHAFTLSAAPLSEQLRDWCTLENYKLVWNADCELLLGNEVSFGQSFEEAVKKLFHLLARSGQPLRATIFRQSRVLEVRED